MKELVGKVARVANARQRGDGEVIFHGSEVASGTYTCTLVLDGVVKRSVKLVKK